MIEKEDETQLNPAITDVQEFSFTGEILLLDMRKKYQYFRSVKGGYPLLLNPLSRDITAGQAAGEALSRMRWARAVLLPQ